MPQNFIFLLGILSTLFLSVTMIMNFSAFQWLHTLNFCFLLTSFFLNTLSSAAQISYADHCNLIVPESSLSKFEPASSSFPPIHTGYYTGGDEILYHYPSENSYSLTFRALNVYTTGKDGLFAVEASLLLRSRNSYHYEGDVAYVEVAESYSPGETSHVHGDRRSKSSVEFKLHGFWSESAGDLCMVGKGLAYSKQGKLLNLRAVLKLRNLRNSCNITSLASGSLESLSSSNDLNNFEPISILILPRMSYKYTLASQDSSGEFSGGNDAIKSLPLSSLPRTSFCSVVSKAAANEFSLKYSKNCCSSKICSPLGEAEVAYVPRVVSLKQIECLEEEKRLRVLIEYPDRNQVDLSKTLVAEGFWDDRMNQFCVVGCRFLNTAESLADAYIGDCTTRLSLSFPSIWSIRETSNIVGKIWSQRVVNDSGYLDKIVFESSGNSYATVPYLKYVYTEINRARQLCLPKRKPQKSKGKKYPSEHSYDMQFGIRVRRPNANSSWGHATPLSVGDQFYQKYRNPRTPSSSSTSKALGKENVSRNSPFNISYRIDLRMQPEETFGGQVYSHLMSRSYGHMEISAEGIYDPETGQLCMIGCRNIVSDSQFFISDSMDCEILLSFQFPPSNTKENTRYIKGSIKSIRVVSDPLYFEPMDVFSVSYTAMAAKEIISQIDWETAIALISNTLACLFVGLQLFHVKKHSEVLPTISLVMLLLLTLGHMVPLMLNIEATFQKNLLGPRVLLSRGGWLEVNQVLVRVITMMALLLEIRLLQLSWSAKLADKADQRGMWLAEMWTLLFSFSFHVAGAFIFLLSNKMHHGKYHQWPLALRKFYSQPKQWEGLQLYAGFVLDGFLLPQIIFNIIKNSKDKALALSFYTGTTSLRLLPHAYNLFYTNADHFSDACITLVSLVGLLFAAILFLQQLFGGRCNGARKHTNGQAYQKIAVVSET